MARSKGRARSTQKKSKQEEAGKTSTVEWHSFFSDRYQREYYYEPNLKLVTWIRPDDLHPEGTPERVTEDGESLEQQQQPVVYGRRVKFHGSDADEPPSRRNSSSGTARGLDLPHDTRSRLKGRRTIWKWLLVALLLVGCTVGGIYVTGLHKRKATADSQNDATIEESIPLSSSTSPQQQVGTPSKDTSSERSNPVEHTVAPSASKLSSSSSRPGESMRSNKPQRIRQQPKQEEKERHERQPKKPSETSEETRQESKPSSMQSDSPRQEPRKPRERRVSNPEQVEIKPAPKSETKDDVPSVANLGQGVPTPDPSEIVSEEADEDTKSEIQHTMKTSLVAHHDPVLVRTCRVPFAHLVRRDCRALAKKQPLVDVHFLLDSMMQ
eukprot:CAMPEP_0194030334 /NCGR_PEP_ID=MMETSP0009_2-20130614/3865_1 /TAXON_ID=210454 /ORGANISM="Grammatophora oceanica, Strain CCMP 410" /LENGTH=381 /DNA_ID=CAMNT_0038670269 /DNA_START=43 /DNA_END=1188 /DNA_ORIENTATION=+